MDLGLWLFNVSGVEYNSIAPGGHIVFMEEVIEYGESGETTYTQEVQDYIDNGFEVGNSDNGYEIAVVNEETIVRKRNIQSID